MNIEKTQINIDIAKAIRKGLEKKGWSQKQLANAIGISQTVASFWCNGQRIPSGDDLIKIAVILDIVGDLFSEDIVKKIKTSDVKREIQELRSEVMLKIDAIEQKLGKI